MNALTSKFYVFLSSIITGRVNGFLPKGEHQSNFEGIM